MSGQLDANDGAEELVTNDLDTLAPKMRERVDAAIWDCHDVGLDAIVYETMRTAELQALYYARGRTRIPPYQRVTNVADAQYGWHFYGLAVDVISRKNRWAVTKDWQTKVADIFMEHGLDWGGNWNHPDYPHFQFAGIRDTPSDKARSLYAAGGLVAVWKAVGAN